MNPPAPTLILPPIFQTHPTQAQISLYALVRHLAPETLRLMGRVTQHCVFILIDGGSTHNFVQDHLVRSLSLSARPTSPLRVIVGNDNKIESRQLCEGATVQVQTQIFTVDFHVLPLCGADMVLGVQWQKSLGQCSLITMTLP